MKKIVLTVLAVLLIAALTITPALAAGGGTAAVSQVEGTPGQTVKVTVSLAGFAKADTIGVRFTYDSRLQLDTANSGWLLEGQLDAIDAANKRAAWCSKEDPVDDTVDVNGNILELAFVVPEPGVGQTNLDYAVSCEVQVIANSSELGTVTADGKVTVKNPATQVTVSSTAVTLDLNGTKTQTLTATVLPANTTDKVIWSSGDSTVAAVSGGTVTALKKGTSVITATAGSKSATCTVTVTCSHDLESHPAVTPNCQHTGNNLYYTCKACSDVFKADGTTPTTVVAETLAITDHSYGSEWLSDATNHWHKCKDCDATSGTDTHSYQWVVDTPATDIANGVKHEQCETCGYKRSEGTVIPHTHRLTHNPAVAATCKQEGSLEHWICESTLCSGVYYKNPQCTETLTSVVVQKNAENHVGGTELRDQQAATCANPGYTGDTYCKGCDQRTQKGETIPATGNHAGGTATCTAQAVCATCSQPYGKLKDHAYTSQWSTSSEKHWRICTTCNVAKTDEAAHDFQWVTDTPATEDTTGIKHERCKSCGYKQNEGTVIDKLPHTHVGITRHSAVAATCVAEGNVEYWTCSSSKCTGKYYEDADCSRELSQIKTPINANNHKETELRNVVAATCYQEGYSGDTYCKACTQMVQQGRTTPATGNHVAGTAWVTDSTSHWHVCTTTGCTAIVEKKAHNYQWKLDKAATEDETGLKHEECECGLKRNEGTVIPKLDHKHVGITHHAAVKATCVKAGTLEYWTCSSHKCTGKYYSDAKCQLELTSIVEKINPDNHTGASELRGVVEATCSEDGYSGDTYCTSCKKLVKKGSVVPATGKHTPKKDYERDEKQHWQLCSHCDALIGNAKEDHTYTWIVDKKATETTEGSKHQKCTVCGHTCNEGTVIDKLPHAPVRVDGKAPTCTEDGVQEHYVCYNCGRYYASENGNAGKEISAKDTVVGATGHTYGTQWLTNAQEHWHDCACGDVADKQAHQTEVVNAKEATETETGYTGDTVCSVCQYVVAEGEEIPVLGTEEPTAPTDSSEGEGESSPVLWIVVSAASVVAVGGATTGIVLWKKRKR